MSQQNLTQNENRLLELLRYGLFHHPIDEAVFEGITAPDWKAILQEANIQVLSSLLYMAALQLPERLRPSPELLSSWKDWVIRCVIVNERLNMIQDEVLSLLNKDSIPAIVIKGTSVSVYYPQPELRPLGDIDILINEHNLDRAMECLLNNGYTRIPTSELHHLGLTKGGAHIELHFKATTMYETTAGKRICDYLGGSIDMAETAELDEYMFQVMDSEHQCVMLLTHMAGHMNGEGIGLRQLCDWAMFVNHVSNDNVWSVWLNEVLPTMGLSRFAEYLTACCTKYIGLEAQCWCRDAKAEITDELFQELYQTGNMGRKGSNHKVAELITSGLRSEEKSDYSIFGYVSHIIGSLTESAEKSFTVCRRIVILKPLVIVYLVFRYIFHSLYGKKPKPSVRNILVALVRKHKVYGELRLFEVDD